MNFVFVGAGRLATNLARALSEQGHRIVAVYSRTMASADALCAVVGGVPTDSLDRLPMEADAFIIAVKDAVLPAVIRQLRQGREGQTFFHTAGSIPISVFGNIVGHASQRDEVNNYIHQHCGVIYPMQTFSKEKQVDFSNVPFFIEASDAQSLQTAREIALSVSSRVQELSSDDRRYLHLAAVFACNFSNHCYTLAARILEQHGLSFDVMLPLIAETADKVRTMPPRDAQTGPAVRYDENVIEAQKALLADDPVMQHIYDIMSKSIHQKL